MRLSPYVVPESEGGPVIIENGVACDECGRTLKMKWSDTIEVDENEELDGVTQVANDSEIDEPYCTVSPGTMMLHFCSDCGNSPMLRREYFAIRPRNNEAMFEEWKRGLLGEIRTVTSLEDDDGTIIRLANPIKVNVHDGLIKIRDIYFGSHCDGVEEAIREFKQWLLAFRNQVVLSSVKPESKGYTVEYVMKVARLLEEAPVNEGEGKPCGMQLQQ